jgi:hypothetical protein
MADMNPDNNVGVLADAFHPRVDPGLDWPNGSKVFKDLLFELFHAIVINKMRPLKKNKSSTYLVEFFGI